MITPLDILSTESWLLLATVLGLISYYVHHKWQFFKKINIPHDPPTVSQFGHFRHLWASEEKAFEYDNEQKRKHGPVWGAFTFLAPAITIHDPDILRQIFIKEFHTFPDRQKQLSKVNGKELGALQACAVAEVEKQLSKVNGKELNTGLTAVQGHQWKRIRTTMTPTFSTSKLKQMTEIIEWCAGNANEAFKRILRSGDGTFNAKEKFSRLSLDIVCSAAFSKKVDSQDDSVKEPEIAKQAKALFTGSLFSPMIFLFFLFPPLEKVAEKLNFSIFQQGAVEYFKKITYMIVDQRKEDPHSKVNRRVDLMQLILDAEITEQEAKKGVEKGLTKTEIIGNSMLMILAGYENTGNQMAFLAYNMAQHPKIQEQVQKEIDEMMEKHGKFDYEGVNSLKLLDMCINETLRLYFPTLRNARIAENEITINGVTIPKGCTVSIPAYGLAHDPDYWDEPYEFKPERMRDMSQVDPMVYQPFGAGPRNCIAMRFALMEIRLSMAKILHQFSFEPAESTPEPPLKLCFGLSVRSVIDYDLKIVSRTKSE